MDLSELIDEIREIEIYGTNPEDWMGYVEYDEMVEYAKSYIKEQSLMYDLNPDEEKCKKMFEFVKGKDGVDLNNLIWALGKLEERIYHLEQVILSIQEEEQTVKQLAQDVTKPLSVPL